MRYAERMSYKPNISPEEAVGAERAARMHKLSANENPFGPSPRAAQVMQDTIATLGMYPPRDDTKFRQALATLHTLAPENFVTANGGCDILRLVALAYLDADSSIVINRPAFPVYARSAKQAGATIIDAGLDPDTFVFRPKAIAQAIRPDTKAVYLCNPNNPTGTTFGQDTFDALLAVIPEDVLVVYDEVYYHFATDIALPDAKAEIAKGRNVLIVHSFSKCYGMAGMRVGYGIAKPDIIEKLTKQKNPFHSNTLAMEAARAALTDKAHIERTISNNRAGREVIKAGLREAGVRYWDSQANFILFQCPEGYIPEALVAKMLEYDVMVREAFDLNNHVRVSIGTPEGNAQFVKAMQSIVGIV